MVRKFWKNFQPIFKILHFWENEENYTYFWITNKFLKGEPQFFIFYLYLSFGKAVFREVTHGLFTFNAPPFNSMHFLSLLAVHELHGRSLHRENGTLLRHSTDQVCWTAILLLYCHITFL